MKLHAHQEQKINELRGKLRTNRAVILRAATGFGKTCCAAFMLKAASDKGVRTIFTVHRQELITQSAELFDEMGIKYGIIASGYPLNPMANVQIASIDTLKRRLNKIEAPGFMVIDECHHCGSKGWTDVVNHWPNAKIVGLSATPKRLDSRGLDHIFQDMVHCNPVSWLIENKYLSPYRYFSPPPPDLSGVHTKMGDYVTAELEQVMDKPKIVGDAVEHYLKLCRDKRAVVFAVSINASKHIAQAFRDSGVMALHIDGETPKEERRKAMAAFKEGHIKVITNCALISEGYDCPHMEAVILMRPTQSLALYLQMVGRCLRYVEGKTAIILDHAGNIRHGLPDDEHDWTLEGKKKKTSKKTEEQDIKTRQCPKCYLTSKPVPKCPHCGHVYPITERVIEEVEGQLRELTREQMNDEARKKKEWNKQLRKCKTEAQLITLAMMKGFKNPQAFADKILSTRAKWQNPFV